MDRHTAGELPGRRVIGLLTRDSRGDSKIKRGLRHRPGISAQSRALCQASSQHGNRDFPAPSLTLLGSLGTAGQHSPPWKGCSHRRLMPCAPASTLSISYESSPLIPTPPSASPLSRWADRAREGQPIAPGLSPMEGALNSHPELTSATKAHFLKSTFFF